MSAADPGPEQVARFGRWALLVLAAAAALFAAVHPGRQPPPAAAYACPMHPEVRSAGPGVCPLCGMALSKVVPAPDAGGGPRLPSGAVEPVRSRIVTEALSAPAFVDGAKVVARVYDDALAGLAPGEVLAFRPAAAPSVSVPVTAGAGPYPAWDGSTSRVELALGRGARLASGTTGWVEGRPRSREVRTISASALLFATTGPYVLVRGGDGGFSPRTVRIGRTRDGSAAVIAGLEEGEKVLIRGAFFVDAERRLAAGSEGSSR